MGWKERKEREYRKERMKRNDSFSTERKEKY